MHSATNADWPASRRRPRGNNFDNMSLRPWTPLLQRLLLKNILLEFMIRFHRRFTPFFQISTSVFLSRTFRCFTQPLLTNGFTNEVFVQSVNHRDPSSLDPSCRRGIIDAVTVSCRDNNRNRRVWPNNNGLINSAKKWIVQPCIMTHIPCFPSSTDSHPKDHRPVHESKDLMAE